MGKISDKIDEIIAKRGQQLEAIKAAKDKALQAESKIRDFISFKEKMANDSETEFSETLLSIKTEEFEKKLKDYLEGLEILEHRLSRGSLNVSFIGRAGQGKSLVMQNISGLDRSVIPSADRGDCTGAKSIITNVEEDKTDAEITFFSEYEMTEIVNKYLEKLSSLRIHSIRDIARINVDKIDEELEKSGGKNPEQEEWIDHLRKYVSHYNDYASDLGRKTIVKKEDIEKYVAQYSHDNPNIKYYKYLGVKLADIRTHFPHEDTGKIVLVDTIGIGATSLGTEDEMLKTAEADSDAILFMFRPDNKRGRISNNEIKIVHDIEEKVSKQYAKEMFFWVVNRVDSHDTGSNVNQVADVVRQINSKDYKNAGVFNVNCADPAETERELIAPLLEHLSSRILEADKIRIDRINAKGQKAFEEYDKICQQLDVVFRKAPSEAIIRKLADEIKDAYETGIAYSLRSMYTSDESEYKVNRKLPCLEFMDEATKKLKNIFAYIPSVEEIVQMFNNGRLKQVDVYAKCSDIIRIKAINDFEELDILLADIVNRMKIDVLQKLTAADKGRLGFILPLESCKNADEWITKFIDKTDCANKYDLFYKALEKFRSYSIKVTGFLIHEVRESFDILDVALAGSPAIEAGLSNLQTLAEEIHEFLEDNTEQAHNDLKYRLDSIYKFPNRSIYAAIQDFYDRISFSKKDEKETVERQMRYFYEDWCGIIWQEECQKDETMRGISEQWNSITKTLKAIDNQEQFAVAA